MKARSLADLGVLRDSLAQQRAQAEAAARLERERRAAEERERRVFADAVGPVTKVQAHPRPPRVPPRVQRRVAYDLHFMVPHLRCLQPLSE